MVGSLDADVIERVAGELAKAESVLFITGAGMSADSGLPTYRGIGGLYEEAATEEGLPIEEALSGPMLLANPALCWKHIARIEAACRGARPNRGHEIVASLERDKPRVCVLTQNVDGLHRAAGSRNVIEIHGDVHRLRCTSCGRREQVEDFSGLDLPPRCARCRGLIRPEVVLFDELLPADEVKRLHAEVQRGFDLVFSVGTTSVFPYIAEPVRMTRYRGGATVEINPGTTEVSAIVDYRVAAGAAAALDAIVDALPGRASR